MYTDSNLIRVGYSNLTNIIVVRDFGRIEIVSARIYVCMYVCIDTVSSS